MRGHDTHARRVKGVFRALHVTRLPDNAQRVGPDTNSLCISMNPSLSGTFYVMHAYSRCCTSGSGEKKIICIDGIGEFIIFFCCPLLLLLLLLSLSSFDFYNGRGNDFQ